MNMFSYVALPHAKAVPVVVEGPLPSLSSGEMLVRVELSGVCATDKHILHGDVPGISYPTALGHEVCGIVVDIHRPLPSDLNGQPLRVGDRVAVMPATPCGKCGPCLRQGYYPECDNYDVLGFSTPSQHPASGGWGQYILCRGAFRVLRTTLPAESAVLVEPASTPMEGLLRAGFTLGDSVLIQGTGTVGLLAVALAAAGGASTIAVIGGPQKRLELAKALGAETLIDIQATADPDERREVALGATAGYDVVLECAGSPTAFSEGLNYVGRGGVYVELGHFSDVGATSINPYRDILSRDLRLVSSSGYTPKAFSRALTVLHHLGAKAQAIVTHRLPLSRANDALLAIGPQGGWRLDGEEIGKVALDPWM